MRKFHARGEPFDLLGDLTLFPTQPAKLNERREMLVHEAIALGLRKCGVVTTSQLVKMQLGRLSSQHYAFFTSEAEALAWIEEEYVNPPRYGEGDATPKARWRGSSCRPAPHTRGPLPVPGDSPSTTQLRCVGPPPRTGEDLLSCRRCGGRSWCCGRGGGPSSG